MAAGRAIGGSERAWRWGLGPVFAHECAAGARRWQGYAGRAVFVGLLLWWLGSLWAPLEGRAFSSLAEISQVAQEFFRGLVSIQMALVLLAAPEATAGAICVEKARGTLMHVLVTDLTAEEIVWGKLAARLAPILGTMACGLPVLALTTLLGGLDHEAIIGAYLVTAGVAMVSCALALTISIWARTAHQALLLTYTLEGVWVAAHPLAHHFLEPDYPWSAWARPTFLERACYAINPFAMAFAPFADKAYLDAGLSEQAACCGTMVLAALALLVVARRRLRPVVLWQANRPARREEPEFAARILDYLPGPSLDGNPVLWREWHREKPTRWVGRFWSLSAIVSGFASLFLIVNYVRDSASEDVRLLAAHVNAWEVSIGLLLLSVSASTALAEERDRGSLDVILATPLPTRAIVWGKWWGSFAMVPRLMILPAWVAAAFAMFSQNVSGALLMLGLILAYAAAITSLGLALATWVPRLGRAITASVAGFALLAAGWPLLLSLGGHPADGLYLGSPFFGVYLTTFSLSWRTNMYYFELDLGYWPVVWIGAFAVAAWVLACATLETFDRCLGRVADPMLFDEAIGRLADRSSSRYNGGVDPRGPASRRPTAGDPPSPEPS